MALSQESYEVCHPLEDDQKIFRAFEENILLKQQIELLNQKIELQKEKLEIKDQLIAVEQRGREMAEKAFNAMKDLQEMTLKFADQAEKKAFWAKWGTIGIILAIIVEIFLFMVKVYH